VLDLLRASSIVAGRCPLNKSPFVRPRYLISTLIVVSLVSSACISARRTPNLEQIFATARSKPGKRPVIVIPGILGSELINSKTGETVWPSAFRTSQEGLPMSPDLAANRDDLVPGKIIETVKLARVLPEVYVYRDLLEALRRYAGYRDGDWENPGADGYQDTFYVFSYDWRQDNVSNARELVRRIVRLKIRLQRPDLKFTIVAHSMGGLIARYAAMYGDADLPNGDGPIQPSWAGAAHISKIMMIGVPNEGSADAFATIIDGYSITEGLRRRVPLLNKLTAEDVVRTPSVFQLMPHRATVKFLDEDLNSLQLDLYDPDVWKRYSWSVIYSSPDFRRRYGATAGTDGNDKSEEELDAYLVATLRRARRFQQALDASDNTESPVVLLAIGGDCEETLNAPVVLRDEKRNRWLTLTRPREYKTSTGAKISKEKATEAMYAPGDGRVTRASLLGENIFKIRDAETGFTLSRYAVFGCDLHGQLPRNKTLQDNALTAIVSEVIN
jgi:pimeloyl-ACP methyl ester carboxylesterase